MHLVIVSGRSGAGKSSALGALEDLNFYCIDNLPVALLSQTIETVKTATPDRNLAVSIDIRTLGNPSDVPALVAEAQAHANRVDVIFIDASDETLARRFSETRRLHPLSAGIERHHLSQALALESERLEPIFTSATYRVDSSGLSLHALRQQVRAMVIGGDGATQLLLKLQSFGFKRGVPLDADLVMDARALPNPHWEADLRPLTGKDNAVAAYLNQYPETEELLDEIESHIRRWLPRHAAGGRQYFTVAIGCTGGQHRSVYLIETLATRLSDLSFDRQVVHRELSSKLN